MLLIILIQTTADSLCDQTIEQLHQWFKEQLIWLV